MPQNSDFYVPSNSDFYVPLLLADLLWEKNIIRSLKSILLESFF